MSLDVYLEEMQPVGVYDANITHNLGKMASQVKVSDTLTLYDILWHADEHGFTQAEQIAELLDVGFNELLADPDRYKQFNPPNGWGTYDNLVNFVYKYRNACWDHPQASIKISR